MRYWLDANIFITAKNTVYAFEINATLWAWMDKRFGEKAISVPARVYREIMDYKKDDLLKQWAINRKHVGMCTEPDKQVWKSYAKIADRLYSAQLPRTAKPKKGVGRRYSDAQIREFDRGADAMVIAHAMADSGTVVTFETDVKPDSKKIRIPDICSQLDVPCINLKDLLMVLKKSCEDGGLDKYIYAVEPTWGLTGGGGGWQKRPECFCRGACPPGICDRWRQTRFTAPMY